MAYQGYLKYLTIIILLYAYATVSAASTHYPFHLYKLSGSEPGPTILIIGGIQGDEPGGFTAATLIAMNYRITKGNVWVVPNLNFKSILYSSRGLHGDMNRKFLEIHEADPDYQIVRQIKRLILDDEVDIVLNLHDGSGFYNPQYIDKDHNPNRWGQSVIIDQESIKNAAFGNLSELSTAVTRRANRLIDEPSRYYVRNTRTAEGDREMEKSLTYFAITHKKAAFGIEASKNFTTPLRAYYHLRVIESFMETLGLGFDRDFNLHPDTIGEVMYETVDISLYKNKFYLPGNDLKRQIYYVPMRKDRTVEYSSKNPLVAVLESGSAYKFKYGNRNISYLHPQYFEFDDTLTSVEISVDGSLVSVSMGDVVDVKKEFSVNDIEGVRVNVIGARIAGIENESGVRITKAMLPGKYGIDNAGTIFRVEFYRGSKYSGMILMRFGK